MKKIIVYVLIQLFFASFFLTAQNPSFQWVKQVGGVNEDACNAITVDNGGNIIVVGYFNGIVDFDPGIATYTLSNTYYEDVFVLKLDALGDFIWAKKIGGINRDKAYGVTVDEFGNTYITGIFGGVVDFDPGPATYTLSSVAGNEIFVLKLDANGDFVWAKQMGGTLYVGVNDITIDIGKNVYTIGYFQGTVDFDPGTNTFNMTAPNSDIFISKLDSLGNFVWAKQMGGNAGGGNGKSIKIDNIGNVYTTGRFGATCDFDPGLGTFFITANVGVTENSDIFVSKLDQYGNFIWAKGIGGSDFDEGYGIDVDKFGNVYTTGYFSNTVDFDPGVNVSNNTSFGNYDIFVLKLNSSGNLLWAKQMGGTFGDISSAIKVDSASNVYTTGFFSGLADFNPGVASYNYNSIGSEDIFVSKLDSSGNFVWAEQMGGVNNESGQRIYVDKNGNVYSIGYFQNVVDFNEGLSTNNLTSNGNNDCFIHKMSQSSVNSTNDNINFKKKLEVYPNPTHDFLYIEGNNSNEQLVELSNTLGQVIFKTKFIGQFVINMRDFPSAIYYLRINNRGVSKIVKE